MYEEIKTACLYVRYSSTSQTEQSIEGQIRVCTEFCQRHNIEITEIYADRATSASKDIAKRTEFLRMIRESEKHNFNAVIVYKLDRFSRSRYDMATYKFRLKKNGVQLISATENISNDPEGIILESVLEGMAEFYSAELSQKIDRGMRESAMKSQYIGGTVPLGYKVVNKKYEIDEETAPLIREAFQRFIAGETIAAICRSFNARGYKTVKHAAFGRSSFAKILKNEKYIGTYIYRDLKTENALPAIIDRETWEKAQMKLNDRKPSGTYKAKRTYLLTGKLFCGHCGNRMQGYVNGAGYAYYKCRGKKTLRVDCYKKDVNAGFIENLVLQDALAMLTDENIEIIADIAVRENHKDVEANTDLPALQTRLQETRSALSNLTRAIESGSAPETLVKRMIELEKEKKTIEAEIKRQQKLAPELDKPRVIYYLEQLRSGDINDPEYQQQIIDLFINAVTIWDTDTPDTHTIQIAYNLSTSPQKQIVGFKPQTSKFEVKSDILFHTITAALRRDFHHKGIHTDILSSP